MEKFMLQHVGENDAVIGLIEDIGRMHDERRHVRYRRAGQLLI